MYEDFYFAEAAPEEFTNYLDGYTYRRNWILLYGKIGDQSIIFPQTSSKGQTELQTREMDLSGEGENETVYFGITAEGAVGDKIGIGYYYIDADGNDQSMSLGTIPFEESTLDAMYEVEVPSSEAAGFYLYTVGAMQNTGDVKLKTFLVSRDLTAGTEFMEVYDYRRTPETSATFFTIEKDIETEGVVDEFAYAVIALDVNMQTGNVNDNSDPSEIIFVGESSAVEGLKASREKIFIHDKLHVVLDKPETVSVYNMAGVLVASYEGGEGDNEFSLSASGVYIVKAGNTIAKVMK